MQRILCFVVLAFGPVACGSTVADADKKDKGEGKGIVVDLDGLHSRTPPEWKEEPPTNRMRFAQFRLPRQKGDDSDAELVIFKGLGGSAKANVERWKQQFQPPEGKKLEDVAKVQDIKVGGCDATLLDVRGTYLFKARPFDPDAKTEMRPDYRMLALHLEGPQNVYHIKLTGPAKTVEAYEKGFDQWLKGFKKD